MKVRNKNIKKILARYKDIVLLNQIATTLQYDLNVSLPEKGSNARAAQISYVTELITKKWVDAEFRKLIEETDEKDLSDEETGMIRNLKHTGHYYWSIPKELIVEFSEVTSKAFGVWAKARDKNSFETFLPDLKRVLGLSQKKAEYLGYKENPYDALLDLYEPGITAKEFNGVIKVLQPELTKLLKSIQKSKYYKIDSDFVGPHKYYDTNDQKRLSTFVSELLGYDFSSGRLDISPHPFTETLSRFDVRVTTRYKTTDFRESLMGTIHETGHALYEQGTNMEFEYSPLDGGVSLGIHESQSRFWENQIGRSREFISFIYPTVMTLYGRQLHGVTPDILFRLCNQVKPSFIRTEADEVTYNLHIALRFEIEKGLINGKMKPEDLPDIWREKMKKYLGIVPDTDREGVLQDVHWSYGSFGYFPTYCLGNLYAAQFTHAMNKELDISELVSKGEFKPILTWLRNNIHQYGSLYWPKELVKKVTNKSLNPDYFITYINQKYSTIYELT